MDLSTLIGYLLAWGALAYGAYHAARAEGRQADMYAVVDGKMVLASPPAARTP